MSIYDLMKSNSNNKLPKSIYYIVLSTVKKTLFDGES